MVAGTHPDRPREAAAHQGKHSGRFGGFDTLRLLAATSVIFSHCFAIVEGNEAREPFVRLLGPGNILGAYGVFTFFILSGFLITRSFVNRKSTLRYFASRSLRIFPALLACLLLLTFVLGPALTTMPLAQYFSARHTWKFLVSGALLFNRGDSALPGVVFSTNDYGYLINGCLWTLGSEFVCYLLVALLGWLRMLRPSVMAALLALGIWSRWTGRGDSLGALGEYFAAGALTFFIVERGWLRQGLLWACALALLAGGMFHRLDVSFGVFGAPLLISFAIRAPRWLGQGARYGDLSYGMYLYGWPIQQVWTRALAGRAEWWSVFLLSLPLAMLFGFVSWHVLEKPALAAAGPLVERTRTIFARRYAIRRREAD